MDRAPQLTQSLRGSASIGRGSSREGNVNGTNVSAPPAVDLASDSSADNRRVAPRTFLMLAATLSCSAAMYQIRIRNVPETGARMEGADLPQVGEEILLSRGETEIDAVIAWVS